METRTLRAAKVGSDDIVRIYAGSVFIWPDPWDDIWDDGGGRWVWDTGWHDVWATETKV